MKNMKIIPEEQAAAAIDMDTALHTVRDAYRACAKGEMYPGGRIVMPVGGEKNMGQWLTAVCTQIPIFGSKFSAAFPDNIKQGLPGVESAISLYSAENGEQLALIGANYLTALKTGAAAGVATELLARQDACRLAIIGTGTQAFAQVLAIQQVRSLTQLRIFDRSPARMDAFAERIAAVQSHPYEIVKCGGGNQCVESADIVCTVTPSRTPVFDGAALRPGTHVNAIGSFTPTMQEIDAATVQKSSFVVTEHVAGLWAAAGDILIPLEQGLIARDKVRGSVGDVLMQNISGRQSNDEITLYESVGSCVLDVAIAITVYQSV